LLQFLGSVVTTDGGLLAYRELDDAVLTDTGADTLADACLECPMPHPEREPRRGGQ
jgi:hypothetical protein